MVKTTPALLVTTELAETGVLVVAEVLEAMNAQLRMLEMDQLEETQFA
jgi:hypothetical protein